MEKKGLKTDDCLIKTIVREKKKGGKGKRSRNVISETSGQEEKQENRNFRKRGKRKKCQHGETNQGEKGRDVACSVENEVMKKQRKRNKMRKGIESWETKTMREKRKKKDKCYQGTEW